MVFTRIREHVPTWQYPGSTNDRVKYRVCFLHNRLHHEYVEKLIKNIFHSQELDEHIAEINVLAGKPRYLLKMTKFYVRGIQDTNIVDTHPPTNTR